MRREIIKNPPKKLFHLSEVNHDGEWFYPRIPKSVCLDAKDLSDKADELTPSFITDEMVAQHRRRFVH